MRILGICAYYQNSGAALLINGEIITAVKEKCFTNITDIGVPINSIYYCLREAEIKFHDLDRIVFYDKPLITSKFLQVMTQPDKHNLEFKLKAELAALVNCDFSNLPPIDFVEDNQLQASSAFLMSPFHRAAVICFNNVGEWTTASVWLARDGQLILQWKLDFPNSLKILSFAFTYYTGIQLNSDEYRLKELARHGTPKYANMFLDKLVDSRENGTFQINSDYLYNLMQWNLTNKNYDQVFQASLQSESKIGQWEMDIAASIQKVQEEIIRRLIYTVYQGLGEDNLCIAGDVAHYQTPENYFRDVWIQPQIDYYESAALAVWFQWNCVCLK
ncbi:hypothetical protein RIVM261_008770 [Rivularia sp. IAM M-261]|nr:hypothetical protein CAL7716_067290 [Calothrix sp. PCC 7716]GJD15921.1 hypothetical protein RIVM261_008770 [Rivularia sp. IAM M-261]